MWKTILLIGLLHGSVSFDAWSTNQRINQAPPGWNIHENNPLLAPFAGKKRMYVAINLPLIPLDVWLLKRPNSRLPRYLAAGVIGQGLYFGTRNSRGHNADWREFDRCQKEMQQAAVDAVLNQRVIHGSMLRTSDGFNGAQ